MAAQLASHAALDVVVAALLTRDFVRADAMPDTIQLINECAGGEVSEARQCGGAVEIWDVRYESPATRQLEPVPLCSVPRCSLKHELQGLRGASLPRDSHCRERLARRSHHGAAWTPTHTENHTYGLTYGTLNGSECPLSPNWKQCLACAGSRLERACGFKCNGSRAYHVSRRKYADLTAQTARMLDEGGPRSVATVWERSWLPLVKSVPALPARGASSARFGGL